MYFTANCLHIMVMSRNKSFFQSLSEMKLWKHAITTSLQAILVLKEPKIKLKEGSYGHTWRGMLRIFVNHVTYATRKTTGTIPKAPLKTYVCGLPFERIAMDIVGSFPTSTSGNKYVLVVNDYFTKWVEAYPLPNIEAKTIAQVFVHEFVSRFGCPLYLQTKVNNLNVNSSVKCVLCSKLKNSHNSLSSMFWWT